jgi:hypothetical protein
VAGNRIHGADLGLLGGVLGGLAGLTAVGDQVEGSVVAGRVGDEAPGGVVELDPVGPQFGGPLDA